MKFIQDLLALVLLMAVAVAGADTVDATKATGGLGNKGYIWNKMTREQADILKLSGDFGRGKVAFQACRGCHRSDASGRADGAYPRLTGQHASVIIKQVTDTRAGLRVNPKMGPFASEHAVSPQEIADISVYLAYVQSEAENGKGPGTNLARGKRLYEENRCPDCHGRVGEGEASKVYPVLASQHYQYALGEMQHVKEGSRANAHPEMAKILKRMSQADLESLSDYVSRMPDYRRASSTSSAK
jgi:cytochrome c553